MDKMNRHKRPSPWLAPILTAIGIVLTALWAYIQMRHWKDPDADYLALALNMVFTGVLWSLLAILIWKHRQYAQTCDATTHDPPKPASVVMDKIAMDARSTFNSLPYEQKQALRIIYNQPGLDFADVSERLVKLGYRETALIVRELHDTNLIHSTSRQQIYPSTNQAVAMEVEELLTKL